ncbi:amine dehydrogenase large subunit [Methylibium sp.]|uniref:amine dehydrogenase large subunit n=1 Tax=Methylibium sp. TaxID=2067992 RepID=UPI00334075E8
MRRIHRHGSAAVRAAACAALLALGIQASAAPAAKARPLPDELPVETLSTGPIAASTAERVYVADVAVSHISDGRIRVFDARHGRFLGMISTGYVGNFTLSANADELYVATTYLSRGSRGERVDVLEVHDTESLAFKYEIALPAKRAQALNYRGLVRASGNGRFVLVQNATPATSITVVDLQQRKVVSEVPTPGCWGILPASGHGSRFSMLCGDGKLATVTLDDNGQVSDRQISEPAFDADADPWFHHAEQLADRYWFVSFKGVLTEVDVGGAVAVVKSARALVGDAGQRAGWRPGGYQPFAIDPTGRWLVVAMHDKGSEGSHKRPARRLWMFDIATGTRVATAPGHSSVSLTFSRSGQRLQALDGEKGALHVWRWGERGKLTPISTVARAGEAAIHLESHD